MSFIYKENRWTKDVTFAAETITFKVYPHNRANGINPIKGGNLTQMTKIFLSIFVNGTTDRNVATEDAGITSGEKSDTHNSLFSCLSNNKFIKYSRKNGWQPGESAELYFNYILNEGRKIEMPAADIVNFAA